MTILKYPKQSTMKLNNGNSKFSAKEFDCKCNNCKDTYIDSDLIQKLDNLREAVNSPIIVTSGYRCPAHNIAIGGAQNSSHTSGMAADIVAKDMDKLYNEACDIFEAVGDGRKKGFVHVDTRTGKKRRWTY